MTTQLCRKCKKPAHPQQVVTKSYSGTNQKSTDVFCASCVPEILPANYVLETVTTSHLKKSGLLS